MRSSRYFSQTFFLKHTNDWNVTSLLLLSPSHSHYPIRALLNVQAVDIMQFLPPPGGSIAAFRPEGRRSTAEFSCAKRLKRYKRRHIRQFCRCFKNHTKWLYLKYTRIAFQGHLGRSYYCVQTFKKSQISTLTFKIKIWAFIRSFLG